MLYSRGMQDTIRKYAARFTAWLQGYLAVASTTAVTFIVCKAAERGVSIDAIWLQATFIGVIGIAVVATEKALLSLSDRIVKLSFMRTFVRIIRLGQPLPIYTSDNK